MEKGQEKKYTSCTTAGPVFVTVKDGRILRVEPMHFTEEEFNRAIELYYEMIGCSPQNGRPHRGKLLELDLEWVEELLQA